VIITIASNINLVKLWYLYIYKLYQKSITEYPYDHIGKNKLYNQK